MTALGTVSPRRRPCRNPGRGPCVSMKSKGAMTCLRVGTGAPPSARRWPRRSRATAQTEPSARRSPQDASGASRRPSARSTGCRRLLSGIPAGMSRTRPMSGSAGTAPATPRRSRSGSTRPRSATRSCSRHSGGSTIRPPQPPGLRFRQPVPLGDLLPWRWPARSRDRITRRRAAIGKAADRHADHRCVCILPGRGVSPALPRETWPGQLRGHHPVIHPRTRLERRLLPPRPRHPTCQRPRLAFQVSGRSLSDALERGMTIYREVVMAAISTRGCQGR